MARYRYGQTSTMRLKTCHPELQVVAFRALDFGVIDITVVYGFRNKTAQNRAFIEGKSKVQWPHSRHNTMDALGRPESEAMDLAPWVDGRIPWDRPKYFYLMSGVVLAAASAEGVDIRWGGDWDRDTDLDDQTFFDLAHFERPDGAYVV